MHLKYQEQLNWKQKRVFETLKRIGGLSEEVAPCEASKNELGYRNKVNLQNGYLIKLLFNHVNK